MINLHQKYNHYLHTDKILDDHDIHERIISYGWRDDGETVIGYYVLTENHILHCDFKERLLETKKRELPQPKGGPTHWRTVNPLMIDWGNLPNCHTVDKNGIPATINNHS